MSWSYSGDPTASPKDEVRFLIHDTDSTNQQVSDEEINYAVRLVYGTTPPSSGNYLPAAYCADNLAARYSQNADSKSVGDLSISFANRSQRFKDIATGLRRRATYATVPVYIGGVSISEKETVYEDSDREGTAITINGMNRLPPTTPSSDGR